MSQNELKFFLGSNSPRGFYSLYDDFARSLTEGVLYIIKGGPGCGKSTFMKRVAKTLSERGAAAEYIFCSGDPESLDAVYFPELNLAYADGTAPHVLEPIYPGAAGRYLNLGVYYDAAALWGKRAEIKNTADAYKALYSRAYSLIAAADAAMKDAYSPFVTPAILRRVRARARGVILREAKSAAGGPVKKRFLGALTCRGRVDFFGTVSALADKVCVIDGEYGLSSVFMDEVFSELKRRGVGCFVCPDEQNPENIRHIIIPGLSLAFVTQTRSRPYPQGSYRHIRLDALVSDIPPEKKRALRTCLRAAEALEKEAVSVLAEAKTLHDDLEAIYNPHVDFAGVLALADAHAANYSELSAV